FSLVPKMTRFVWSSLAVAAVLLSVLPRDLHIINLAPGDRVRVYRDGIMAAVSVVDDATQHRTLRVNNHFQMGGTGAADAEYRHAHIPLLLHPNPKRALILGVGTGISLGGATLHPDLK